MPKSFSKFLFAIILFLVFPVISFAQVSKIVFTTDSQSIRPNEPSGPIIIQAQNSASDSEAIGETSDVFIQSSSSSGEFSSSMDNWQNAEKMTMNSNWANRTFYYRDSTNGTFTIMVKVIKRISLEEWTASQQITISSSASQVTDPNPPEPEVLGASTESSSSSGSASSSGGGTTDKVSSLNAQLEILAGSDRTTSPGSPIWFQATVKKNTTGASPELNWSFGDGNVGVGPLVSHTYKYPGDYAVVLSAGAGDIFSVSRLKVKVAESNLSVSDGGEYLEISNNGSTEINLFNWKIENNGKGFIFQPNTIVLAKSSIKLDKSLLMMKGLDNSLGLSLKNSLKEEVFAVAPVVPIKEVDLKEISKNLGNIKKEFSVVQEKANNLGLVSANVFPTVSTNEKIETDSINSPQATTSAENIIYEAPKSSGIFSRAWNFLIGMLH